MAVKKRGKIDSDPAQSPWTLVDPDSGEVISVANPLGSEWRKDDHITVEYDEVTQSWEPSVLYQGLESAATPGAVGHGRIVSDPYSDNWTLFELGSRGRRLIVKNALPPSGGTEPQFDVGDYIALDYIVASAPTPTDPEKWTWRPCSLYENMIP